MTNKKIGYLLIFLAGILWGTIGIFVKQLEREGVAPAESTFLRMSLAFLILLAVCVMKGGWKSLIIDGRALVHCTLLGIVCQGISNLFYNIAVTLVGVSVSAVLLNIAPVFTLLFSAFFFSEKITGKKFVAIVINVIGCIFTATNGHLDFSQISIPGILYGIGSGITYGMMAIFGRMARGHADPFVMSMYSYLTGSVFLFLCTCFSQQPFIISGAVMTRGFLFALIPTAVAYVLYFMGLQMITEPSKAPVLSSVMTVVAALIGILLYKEKIELIGIAGIILVLSSIMLINVTAVGDGSVGC